MKEVIPGIFSWSVFNEEKGLDFNGHLVAGSAGLVVIDPPAPAPPDLAALDAAGRPEAIVITNAHHTRDAVKLAARWQVPLMAPRADAPLLPQGMHLDALYDDGDRLPGGLRVITLSGQKTPGESALFVERSAAVIVGDAVIGKPPGKLSLLPAAKYADPRAAMAGLRRLLTLSFDAVLVGDGASLPRGGRRAVEELFASGA